MGLFGFFKKKHVPSDAEAWFAVAGKITSLLEYLLQNQPEMLANPYTRVVLRDDWGVHVAADKRDPKQILGPHDVTFFFLQEDEAALSFWVKELRDAPDPFFAQVATEEYAKRIVRTMMANAQVVG
jgi:hypothetical protein